MVMLPFDLTRINFEATQYKVLIEVLLLLNVRVVGPEYDRILEFARRNDSNIVPR